MRILVAYLDTPGGADALMLGQRLARSFGGVVDVTMVMRPESPTSVALTPGDYNEVLAEQFRAWLEQAQAAVDPDLLGESRLRVGESVVEELIADATENDAEMIVVGGTGGGLLPGHTLGTVVNELVHTAPLPVALTPRGLRDSEVARVDEITCAIGRRPGATRLLETAVRYTEAGAVPLRLLSLVALDPEGHRGERAAELRDAARAHAQNTLEAARAALPEGYAVTAEVGEGGTVEEATAELSWHDGQLLMVGSSRLAQPRRLFLGSTAAKMLRVLEVPVVVVPSPGADDE
ncbi:universal stress protein [Mycolicibacterium brumae]|uniref:Universal stress protein n=1 Tax=Mycolicibacterium brumae TaxID=85968 RepID=A0A2G5PB46_9MYCO|nr:universal stress protein [Mycolicibacterium brumae]MCV7193314.1 universal stress protein [Mycolicibacterium brumae]PIB75591.1 universal stress protein [Mycolicibacterium brumae]RWA21041.1 hypothetical protein MBRU_15145 [Mycolicibacterium brumae DSM 44177]UWW09971.1 universal stress protein [Mycolicibacterium brumae]